MKTKQKITSRKFGYGIVDMELSKLDAFQRRALNVWRSAVSRCVPSSAERKRHTTYAGCTLHPSWRLFSVFLKWYTENYVNGYDLDKDLLARGGNLVYGPNTCVFVPHYINMLVRGRKRSNNTLPEGVQYCKHLVRTPYRVSIHMYGRQTHVGYFADVADASKAYMKTKARHIRRVANWFFEFDMINEEIYAQLLTLANEAAVVAR